MEFKTAYFIKRKNIWMVIKTQNGLLRLSVFRKMMDPGDIFIH
jgi:hypothetical protein